MIAPVLRRQWNFVSYPLSHSFAFNLVQLDSGDQPYTSAQTPLCSLLPCLLGSCEVDNAPFTPGVSSLSVRV